MAEPPVGYDDDSVVPKKRLVSLLENFEDSLGTIQKVFEQSLPSQFETPTEYDETFELLNATAQEVGEEYSFLVEKLLKDYTEFTKQPDEEKLKQLFNDVKSLQLLLVG